MMMMLRQGRGVSSRVVPVGRAACLTPPYLNREGDEGQTDDANTAAGVAAEIVVVVVVVVVVAADPSPHPQ